MIGLDSNQSTQHHAGSASHAAALRQAFAKSDEARRRLRQEGEEGQGAHRPADDWVLPLRGGRVLRAADRPDGGHGRQDRAADGEPAAARRAAAAAAQEEADARGGPLIYWIE